MLSSSSGQDYRFSICSHEFESRTQYIRNILRTGLIAQGYPFPILKDRVRTNISEESHSIILNEKNLTELPGRAN